MSIWILNCMTIEPWFPRWQVGTPCLLVETDQGLVLVDTGLGLRDYAHPSPLVRFFRSALRIPGDPEQSAARQIARRRFPTEAVKHIILTHLHFDHAGGLPDFPNAQVHIHQREYDALRHPQGWTEHFYDPCDFVHGPHWVLYEETTADWYGFDAIRLPFIPEMYFIPLFGHTRGHCGVAIRNGNDWIFQCGDALPTNVEFDVAPEWIYRLVIGPHVPHLRLWSAAHPNIQILAAHMWLSFFETRQAGESMTATNL